MRRSSCIRRRSKHFEHCSMPARKKIQKKTFKSISKNDGDTVKRSTCLAPSCAQPRRDGALHSVFTALLAASAACFTRSSICASRAPAPAAALAGRARPPPPPRAAHTRAPAAQDSYINKKLSLISKAKIRYEGVLTDIDLNNQTLTLKNVRPASGRARAVRQNSAAARARS